MGEVASQRRIIGLTGGIATGKSTASAYLSRHHQLPVLDADAYARQAVEKGSATLAAIAHRYGSKILLDDGTLDRAQLGRIIFNNLEEKNWIEQQIHPFVQNKFKTETALFSPLQTLVYSIPLLFEANLTHIVTEIWVVTCQLSQQKQRLMHRSGLSSNDAQRRIDAQMSLASKCQLADHVLDNSADIAYLYQQINALI